MQIATTATTIDYDPLLRVDPNCTKADIDYFGFSRYFYGRVVVCGGGGGATIAEEDYRPTGPLIASADRYEHVMSRSEGVTRFVAVGYFRKQSETDPDDFSCVPGATIIHQKETPSVLYKTVGTGSDDYGSYNCGDWTYSIEGTDPAPEEGYYFFEDSVECPPTDPPGLPEVTSAGEVLELGPVGFYEGWIPAFVSPTDYEVINEHGTVTVKEKISSVEHYYYATFFRKCSNPTTVSLVGLSVDGEEIKRVIAQQKPHPTDPDFFTYWESAIDLIPDSVQNIQFSPERLCVYSCMEPAASSELSPEEKWPWGIA